MWVTFYDSIKHCVIIVIGFMGVHYGGLLTMKSYWRLSVYFGVPMLSGGSSFTINAGVSKIALWMLITS